MRRRLSVLALVLLLALSVPCVPALCETTAQDGTLLVEVAQTACNIVRSGDYYLVYCYAQVHNQSGQILCLDEGHFELYNGDQLLATQSVTRLWPYFLSPGEDGYLFDVVAFEPNEDGSFVPSVSGLDYFVKYMPVDSQFAGMALPVSPSIERDASTGKLHVVCELSNPSAAPAYDPSVTFGLYLDSGAMLYADGVTLQNVGIPAGGTTLVRFPVDDTVAKQWESYGVTPARVQAKAIYRADSD